MTHLHQVDEVHEELVGVLLSVGGELRVSCAHQGLEHPGRDAFLLVLQPQHSGVTYTGRAPELACLKRGIKDETANGNTLEAAPGLHCLDQPRRGSVSRV